MRIAYLDCVGGIAGDMCLGALVDAGLPLDLLEQELRKLPVEGWRLRVERVRRSHIAAARVLVDLEEVDQPHRRLADILSLIDRSPLPPPVKEKSAAVFQCLALAEARVHDTTPEHIHFHEVGAVDAVVDVVGTVSGLHTLGVERVFVSPLPLGTGFIRAAHGCLPLPAPAVLEILKDVPVYGAGATGETVTPTGAALAVTLAAAFGPLPALIVEKTGYGAGQRDGEKPNLLRLILGRSQEVSAAG